MSKHNGSCKNRCILFKAKKPSTGGRYDAGQYRCQICEIYITDEGVEKNHCKCCNYKIRSKPRNRVYKERYRARVGKTPDNQDTDRKTNHTDIDGNKHTDNSKTVKKSTPIYDDVDKNAKTEDELKEFLDSINLTTNHPLVMLKELVEYGKLHKGEIAESLAYFNNKDTDNLDSIRPFFSVSVYEFLVKSDFVKEVKGLLEFPYYVLNVRLESFQLVAMLEHLVKKIAEYNMQHNIPENKYPYANNMDNIDWSKIDPEDILIPQTTKNSINDIAPLPSKSFWIWSVTPENWDIIRSKNVWGSILVKEKIGSKVQDGDQVAFYVTGTKSFKGIFEFVGGWFESKKELWEGDLQPDGSIKYVSCINLNPIKMGAVPISSLDEKIQLFIDKPTNIRNLILKGNGGYPSNHGRSLLKTDFEIIKNLMTQNSLANNHSQNSLHKQDFQDIKPKKRFVKIVSTLGNSVNISHCKIEHTYTIQKNQIVTNDEICSLFGVANMGGIRYSKNTNVIVLLSSLSNDYVCGIHPDSKLITYSGEKKSNEEIKHGNEKISNSKNIPMVFFQEIYQKPGMRKRGALDNKYKFIGTVRYLGHFWESENNKNAIKFVLEIVS